MKPIKQATVRQLPLPPAAPPLENPTLERKGPSAEQRTQAEKAELRTLLSAEGRMDLYYHLYPLEAPAGYCRSDERAAGRDRSTGREL